MEQSLIDETAGALCDAIGVLARAAPAGWVEPGAHGSEIVVSGTTIPSLNGIATRARAADPAEIGRLGARLADADLPWGVQVRGEPSAEVLAAAAGLGLTELREVPLMACTSAQARLRAAPACDGTVRRITGAERQRFADTLAAGFDVPGDTFEALTAEPVLEAPGATPYLIERDGVPVATGYALRTGGFVGVFHIATRPEHRGRGYGRLVTETLLRDAFDAGVTVAYLQPSAMGLPLYGSLGFATVEQWTYLQA